MLIAGVKGGLVGVVITVLVYLLGQAVPGLGLLVLIMPIITGLLAGLFLLGPRSIGNGAGAGAIGSAIAGLISGVLITILVAISLGQYTDAQLAELIRERVNSDQLAQANITADQLAQTVRGAGLVGIGACCVIAGPLVWALFGTLGGMLAQAFRPAAPLAPPYLGAGQPYYGQQPMGYDKVNPNYPHPPAVIGGEVPKEYGQPLYPPQSPYGQPPVYGQPTAGQPPVGYDRNDPNYPHPPSAIGGETPPSPYGQPPYGQPPYGDDGDKAR